MITFFQSEKTFYKLRVTLTVDAKRKSAEVMIAYDRLIIRIETVPFHEVYDPAAAEKWLHRPIDERGNYIERLEWMCKTGILAREQAA